MIVPDAAVEAAARYVSRSVYGQPDGPDDEDWRHGRELVLRVAGHIAAAERKRIASIINPRKLDALAHSTESGYKIPPAEFARDLRLWARVLRDDTPGPSSLSDMLTDAAEAIGVLEGS